MNSIRYYTCLVAILFMHVLSYGQAVKYVSITGKIDIAENGDIVQVCTPVSGYFNFFPAKTEEFQTTNRTFSSHIQLTKNGIIELKSKDLPRCMFYAEPGDSLSIEVFTAVDGKQNVIFHGKNALGNELLTNRKLLNNGVIDMNKFVPIIENSENSTDALNQLHKVLAEYTTKLEKLHQNNQITDNCHNALLAETEQRLVFWSGNTLGGALKDKVKTKMSRSELLLLVKKLYAEYDPFDSRYAGSSVISITAAYKCNLIQKGILPEVADYTNYWEIYAKGFEGIDGNFASFDHGSLKIRELLVGNDLLTALIFKSITDKDYLEIFKKYYTLFPESPYVPLITGILLDKLSSNMTQEVSKEEKIIYLDSLNKVVSYKIPEYTNLDNLIANQFKGKAVFVDFWATYCSPCVQEFKSGSSLNKFLTKHNIALLYVSVDNKGSEEYWAKLMKDYKLKGYHYFSNDTIRNQAGKMFNGIPRYMLYNEKGLLVEADAYRPSTTTNLYKQIAKRLNFL